MKKRNIKNVRLSENEIRVIKQTAKEIFGSIADLTKKGGDIDIFVETDKITTVKDEIKFLVVLERKGIERKVDLVIKYKGKKDKPFLRNLKELGFYCELFGGINRK